MQRGWLPEWLPRTATRIHERHNMDASARMWVADVPVGVEVVLPASCSPVKATTASKPPFERDWWPVGAPTSTDLANSYLVFQCADSYVGLAAQGGRLVGWSRT